MNTLSQQIKALESRIDVMMDKYNKDPCWMNKTLLDCMLRDYESKQKILLQDAKHKI